MESIALFDPDRRRPILAERNCRLRIQSQRRNRTSRTFLHPRKYSSPLATVTPYEYSNQTCLKRAGAIELRQSAKD
jgi:hypothetical protein